MTRTYSPGAAEVNGADTSKGIAISFLGGLMLSFDVPLLKLAGADPYTLIYARGIMLFAAMFLFWLFFTRLRGHPKPFINGKTGMIIALFAGISNIMFIFSISLTSVANVVFILAFNPMFAGLLGWAFLGERLHPFTWAAILASLSGVAIIVAEGLEVGTWKGDLLAVGVATMMALSLTLIRYRRSDQSMSAATGHLLAAAVVAPLAHPGSLTASGWGWLALNGMLAAPAANAFLMLGPRYVAAAVVAMFFLLETVLTPVWMWFIFAEVPSTQALIGGSVVILALLLHSIWKVASTRRLSPRREIGPSAA